MIFDNVVGSILLYCIGLLAHKSRITSGERQPIVRWFWLLCGAPLPRQELGLAATVLQLGAFTEVLGIVTVLLGRMKPNVFSEFSSGVYLISLLGGILLMWLSREK